MNKRTLIHLAKSEVFIAIVLYLLPLIYFINPINIKQVEPDTLLILIIFYFLTLLLFLIFISLIKKFFIKKKINNLYIFLTFFYFTLFTFNEFFPILNRINELGNRFKIFHVSDLTNDNYFKFFYFVIMFIFTTFLFYLNNKFLWFDKFFRKFIIIFIFLNIFFSISNFLRFQEKSIEKQFVANDLNSLKIESQNHNIKKKRNIYYVIFDGMISLENAYQQKIIPNKENYLQIKKDIENLNLKYIPKTISNYNRTYLTLSSIFYLNSPVNEKSKRFHNRKYLFPAVLNKKSLNELSKKNITTLPNFLIKNDFNLYYFGNSWNNCVNDKTNNWNCYAPNSNNKFKNLIQVFYQESLFANIVDHLLKYNKSENTADFFYKNLKTVTENMNNKLTINKKNFAFVHFFMPHKPYLTKDCNYSDDTDLNPTSYSYSYSCAIKFISNITTFFNKEDPDAILVFQADHGEVVSIDSERYIYTQEPILNGNINKNIKDEFYYRSSIFNAIKAPDRCFDNFDTPTNNSNTIKFILSCVSNYKLNYDEVNHYIGFGEYHRNYGKIFKLESE